MDRKESCKESCILSTRTLQLSLHRGSQASRNALVNLYIGASLKSAKCITRRNLRYGRRHLNPILATDDEQQQRRAAEHHRSRALHRVGFHAQPRSAEQHHDDEGSRADPTAEKLTVRTRDFENVVDPKSNDFSNSNQCNSASLSKALPVCVPGILHLIQ